MYKKLALVAVAALLFSGCVTSKSAMLTDKSGMTLYTFDKDSANKSNCYGGCEKKWPVFSGEVANTNLASSDFSTITRKNGAVQTAYKQKPLYYFFKDAKPGDKNGDGLKGVWHIAK